MFELLARIIPLGIGAALTPSLFALQILTTGATPWRAKAAAVVLGMGSAFGLVMTALLIGFAQLPTSSPGRDVTAGVVWCVAGLLLAVIAVWLFTPHPHLAERLESSLSQRVEHASVRTFFVLAFVLSAKDVSSFVLLVPAIHDVAVAPLPILEQAVAAALVFVVAMSAVLVPPVVRLVGGHRSDRALDSIYTFTMTHQLQIGAVVAIVFAVYLLMIGTGPNGLAWR